MTTFHTNMRVNRVSDEIWEIPTSEKSGMIVPARIYATEGIISSMDQGVFEQVTNVACLPGIQRYALCMPDGHWGYGFPIGGVAAFDVNTGVISPGGVGYDVNCIDGYTYVLSDLGYHRQIKDLDRAWQSERVTCINPSIEIKGADIRAFIRKSNRSQVFRVTTESGREVSATGDHPFWTRKGMVPLRDLEPGDEVSTYAFEGVPYEAPPKEVLLTEDDVARHYPGSANGLMQCMGALKKRGLVPLRMDNVVLPYIVRLMGFIQGDGHLQLDDRGRAQIGLYGAACDLAGIRKDVERIGFRASKIYERTRTHEVVSRYGRKRFTTTHATVRVQSSALAVMLVALGTSKGNKAAQPFDTPKWLDRAPQWMRRLYLAALFGAELSAPKTVTGHHYNFYGPMFSLNKRVSVVQSGQKFLQQIQGWLKEFGIESTLIAPRDEGISKSGEVSIRLRLLISRRPENLICLWSRISYECNQRKQHLASIAVHYLKAKAAVLQERAASAKTALSRKAAAAGGCDVAAAINVRINQSFPKFPEFLLEKTRGLGKTGQVWETIIRKEAIDHHGPVYDLTVLDEHHNFIANGFVVSNCGMRLIRTNLTLADVQPRLEELMTTLFKKVPAGVGSKGFVRVNRQELENVMRKGARWCVENGYGWREDLERIEEHGCILGADPSKVSAHAVERGIHQLGTLGSGNHYLEVQVVADDRIFDRETAAALGITGHDQIVVMVHCGSRGFGHQVASDALKIFEKAMRKCGITVKDQQLACAPFRSPEGQDYFAAMNCAANNAFANRQVITHQIRAAFEAIFGQSAEELGMEIVYDVAHNIAKVERYKEGDLVVHRKGSTRSFGPGRPEVPEIYRKIGQPVICGGSMETGSYLLVGTDKAMTDTFGSTMHGSGRTMSRHQAKRSVRGEKLKQDMKNRGIIVKAVSMSGLAEEAGFAYKNISEVVEAVDRAGITKKVAELRPIGNIKG